MVIFQSHLEIFHRQLVIFQCDSVVFHSVMVIFQSHLEIFHCQLVIFQCDSVVFHSVMLTFHIPYFGPGENSVTDLGCLFVCPSA
jgi:hypothetical protein